MLRELQDTEDESKQALKKKYKDVYVNEDLTSKSLKRAGWARQGREWKQTKKITDSWARDGWHSVSG